MLLLVRALLSWFVRDPYSTLGRFYDFMAQLTEPFVAPCRQLLSRWNTGMIDFSVLLAFFLIRIVERLLVMLIQLIF
jgi:YggT family protein